MVKILPRDVDHASIPRLVPDEAARVASLSALALVLIAIAGGAEVARRRGHDVEPSRVFCTDGATRVDGRIVCGASGGERLSTAELLLLGTKIDINEATPADLELIPGIGPQLARRIVEDRARHGPFPATDSVDRVPGIGRKLVETIRGFARVRP